MPFHLVITEKGGKSRSEAFDLSEITIGRVQDNDIVLPKGNISKRHSRIVLRDGKFIIVDLKSTNGTFVNGKRISSPMVLKDADKIYIGDFILQLQQDGRSAPPRPRPPPPPPTTPAHGNRNDADLATLPGGEPIGSRPPAPAHSPQEQAAALQHLLNDASVTEIVLTDDDAPLIGRGVRQERLGMRITRATARALLKNLGVHGSAPWDAPLPRLPQWHLLARGLEADPVADAFLARLRRKVRVDFDDDDGYVPPGG